MREVLKSELKTWAHYFVIALIAEIAGFVGWLGEITSDGTMFQLSAAFWAHEISRLYVWLPVFMILSSLRLILVYIKSPSSN